MKRLSNLRILSLWLIMLLVLSGCAYKDNNDQLSSIQEAIKKLRTQSEEVELSEAMFRRKMTLNYPNRATRLTPHQEKVIDLFFQTLPDSNHLSIIISMSPTSRGEDFEALHSAWLRSQNLTLFLRSYTEKIEELYLPDQSVDSVTIQVLGGEVLADEVKATEDDDVH